MYTSYIKNEVDIYLKFGKKPRKKFYAVQCSNKKRTSRI